MIFGKTACEKRTLREKTHKWHVAYAWWPVRLTDGRWAWLEAVDRIAYMSDLIEPFTPQSACGWCYRLPPKETAE